MPRVTSIGGHRVYIADGTLLRDYQIAYENFGDEVTSITDMETMGWVETDINTATSASVTVIPENNFLLVNAGTKADSGSSLQLLTPTTATHTNRPHKSIGPITSTATLMDGRSMFFFTRIGFAHTTAAWDNKLIIGWVTQDTSLMTAATGAESIATGGGLYFHFQESAVGPVLFSAQRKAAAASTTELFTQGAATSATVVGDWIELGFLATWVDADDDADNGIVYFYVNGILAGSDSNNLPMASTEVYAVSMELLNGPATDQNVDMGVDYIITGISGPGR
jgi:hypothetical protein